MSCDGSVIPPPSPWAGYNTPDLNAEGRFLRGGFQEDVLTLQDDMLEVSTQVRDGTMVFLSVACIRVKKNHQYTLYYSFFFRIILTMISFLVKTIVR